MSVVDILAQCTLFAGLPVDHLTELAHIIQKKSVKRGSSIFFENDPGLGFYLVAKGKVKIFKMSFNGKEQILHILPELQPFGEVAVFQDKPFPANAEALVNSDLLYFPKDAFISVIERHPKLALNMLGLLSWRLRQFTRQIEDLSLKEVPHRLAGYIVYLTKEQNSSTVHLDISKGQLASLLGTVPETLSRILAKMTAEEILRIDNRKIEILDMEKLVSKTL